MIKLGDIIRYPHMAGYTYLMLTNIDENGEYLVRVLQCPAYLSRRKDNLRVQNGLLMKDQMPIKIGELSSELEKLVWEISL